MSDLFFYGTLRYIPLLEHVLGRSRSKISITPAVLPDHGVYAVQDQSFPMILHDPGGNAQGIVVRGLSETDLSRLAYYEGGFDYELQTHDVSTSDGAILQVQLFFPEDGAWKPGDPWLLDAWSDRWADLTMIAAQEVMTYFGRVESGVIARSFPAIRTRAWARLAARQRQSVDTRNPEQDVIVHRRSGAYVNYFGMEEVDLQHRLNDGTMGPVLNRNSLLQGSAVVVLPYDPVRDSVLLVEQFRVPVFLIDDPDPWMWEPVAGMIDPGEMPAQAAHREAREEAHITLNRLEYAGGAYSSSGSSTEYVHMYVGLADLIETVDSGGLKAEGEDIRSKIIPFDQFMDMIDTHAFKDLPLLTLAHWLARHRDRLRA